MRLLCLSDEVDERFWGGQASRLRPDVILACGDVPFALVDWLADVTGAPVAFVPGNHDPDLSGFRVTRRGLVLRSGLPTEAPWPAGAVNVDGRLANVGGLRVAGLGGCPRYSPGANQYSERQQAHRVDRLLIRARRPGLAAHRPVSVVMTHAPLRGIGDDDDPAHRGFVAYHRLIRALRPRLWLHGHVKPAPGTPDCWVGSTRVVNVFNHRMMVLDDTGAGE